MEKLELDIVYGVQNDYENPRKQFGDLFLFASGLPKNFKSDKYLDTKKSYRHKYYFSTEDKAREFEDELWNKYKHKGE